ncbi:MAG: NAD-binding protein, partial [Pseudomonadota bacterium]|nr:NAD-binding protein [Pseudomonadota bacterium]
MQSVIFVILRRMRAPLTVLICSYAISVLGLTLIPGIDDQGNPWHMDFFHAFYFVSFMGSTIGFGEIPYPFTDAQRLWTLFTIYATVVVWLYAIGTTIALIQTPSFRAAVAHNLFTKRIRRLRETFYLICGYGDTGRMLVHALVAQNQQVVVVDTDPARIDELELAGLPVDIPALCGDASDPSVLEAAGLKSDSCAGVIALIRSDDINLKIAVAAKLLHPRVRVFCRSEHHDTAANMASFGTDHIINPYDTFADDFATALSSPSLYLLRQWLTSPASTPLTEPVFPPHGLWILCGYGRFGKALYDRLTNHGERVQVVEAAPELTRPPEGTITGRGTEAETLEEANIENAVGIIAGTDNDVNNLSILMTAETLKPKIFTLARQEFSADDEIFEAVDA